MGRIVEIRAPSAQRTCAAVLSYWYKKEGDRVEAGEDLLDYETDKATVTIEAPCSGRLVSISVPEDGIVRPEILLGSLEVPDEP